MSVCTDLSKAIMQDGEWFLVPAEHVNEFVSVGRVSVIVHQCHKWSAELRSPDQEDGQGGLPYDPLGYWTVAGSERVPCKLCKVRAPEAIASLWLLHNFDTFACDSVGSRVGRMISAGIRKSFHAYEREYFVQDSAGAACGCIDCVEKIGAWHG